MNKMILENSKHLNILYVEDDESIRKLNKMFLLNFFKKVDTAFDGEDGLNKYTKYLNEHKRAYDLVITDISMPRVDGLSMSQSIKDILNDQEIVVVSAYNESEYLKEAIKIGIDAFISKPIKIDEFKEVLYKVTQKITEKKLLSNYYEELEDINILNMDKKNASKLNFTSDIVLDFENNKDKILDAWLLKDVVKERLKKYAIDIDYFAKHFAIKVLDYFIDVVNHKAMIGSCPVIIEMLSFFKHKHLTLDDIFMICVEFKNNLTIYTFTNYSFNEQLYSDLSYILDKNFEGVVRNYIKLRDCQNNDNKSNALNEQINLKDKTIEHMNFKEYLLENDLYELKDLEDDIDNKAISATMNSNLQYDDIESLGLSIKRYGEILSNYPLFRELGRYIIKLGLNFIENSLTLVDKEKMLNITALLEGFVNDLIVWRKEIFENDGKNPDFLNNSFSSNVDTIIMLIEYDESKVDNNTEVEFF